MDVINDFFGSFFISTFPITSPIETNLEKKESIQSEERDQSLDQTSIVQAREANLSLKTNTDESKSDIDISTVVSQKIPAKKKPPSSFSLALVKRVIAELRWEESYPLETTLRQAIIDYVIQEFEKAKEPKILQFFKLFNKLLNFDQYVEALEDMNFLSMGSRIKLLLNEKTLLDVPVQKLASISSEAEIKDLVIYDQNIFLQLSNITNCFEKLSNIQCRYIDQIKNEIEQRLDSMKEKAISSVPRVKSKMTRITFEKKKIRLHGEENFIEFFSKCQGYQIFLRRLSSLKKNLLAFSKEDLKKDQKCLQLNQMAYQITKFTENSTRQYNDLNECLQGFIKELATLLTQNVTNIFLGNMFKLLENLQDDSTEESPSFESLFPKSIASPVIEMNESSETLDFYKKIEENLNQYSTLYFAFLNGMINYLHQQEILLTNTDATPEELQETSAWMGSVLRAEKKVKNVEFHQNFPHKNKKKSKKTIENGNYSDTLFMLIINKL